MLDYEKIYYIRLLDKKVKKKKSRSLRSNLINIIIILYQCHEFPERTSLFNEINTSTEILPRISLQYHSLIEISFRSEKYERKIELIILYKNDITTEIKSSDI